jgi:hypothetical protein
MLREMVLEYLKGHNYDGLYNDDCACLVEDLMPCNEPCLDCKPGVKVEGSCDEDCEEEHGFQLRAAK